MSDKQPLGKRRTIRFSAEIDQLIAARAEEQNQPISKIIRVAVLAGLPTNGITAGEWINSVVIQPRRPLKPARVAFRKKYLDRHE